MIFFDFLFDLFFHSIAQTTGHVLIYIATFGRGRCEDETATIIGVIFWVIILLLIVFHSVRFR